MAAQRPKETRRRKEIGASLFSHELELIQRAALSRNAKLATYVREAVLEVARRDLDAASETAAAGHAETIDKRALIDEISEEMMRRLGDLLSGRKINSPED